jgi:hypothetical protein
MARTFLYSRLGWAISGAAGSLRRRRRRRQLVRATLISAAASPWSMFAEMYSTLCT